MNYDIIIVFQPNESVHQDIIIQTALLYRQQYHQSNDILVFKIIIVLVFI